MTPNQCRAQIKNLTDTLSFADLAVYTRPVIVRQSGGGCAHVTWAPGLDAMPGRLFLQDFYCIETFLGWLEAEEFSLVLFDGAILQLSFDFFGSNLTGHRLAYIPCPFLLDVEGQELLREQPILDVIALFRAHGEQYLRLRAPIRFDFDPNAVSEEHPASHLTLNDQECRVPVRGPVSLGHFVDFVFRNFYPTIWAEHEFLREVSKEHGPRLLTPEHEGLIHLDWRADQWQVAEGGS